MSPVKRDQQLRIRASADEIRMLKELADAKGLSASDVVRALIRDEHEREFSMQKIEPSRQAIAKVMKEHGVPKTEAEMAHQYRLAQAQTMIDEYQARKADRKVTRRK
jgi:hypothetical protein